MKYIYICIFITGCIRAPEIVLVDRATALEQQAAGSFDELERKLTRSGIAPRPVPLTPDELEALGVKSAPLVDSKDESDADRIDELLQQRCIGEAKDGTLADTHDACRGATDHADAIALIDRVNHARAQLWRWMHDRKPGSSIEELRRAWQKTHARGVTCGGWSQRDDGTWEDKKC
jgi:hypothetical protein